MPAVNNEINLMPPVVVTEVRHLCIVCSGISLEAESCECLEEITEAGTVSIIGRRLSSRQQFSFVEIEQPRGHCRIGEKVLGREGRACQNLLLRRPCIDLVK